MIFLFTILPPVIHELGHFLAALLFGKVIKFRFSFGKIKGIPVPRWVWNLPSGLTKNQIIFVTQAGFVYEFIAALFLPKVYLAVACLHFTLYPWYAGKENDFSHLGGN